MGNCLASTPIQHYWSYFQNIKVSEIQDYWTTFQVFKIKKLYDQASSQHPQFSKYTHIEEQKFIQMFPQINNYPQKQKQRFFQIFNYDGHGFVDWNNFFSMISICYFASEQVIWTVLFLIFDQSLCKYITKPQLQLLVQLNQNHIIDDQEEDPIPKYTINQIVQQLLNGKQELSLSKWQQQAKQYFNISKIRKIFNIFNEQKMQKQLIKNFSQWNKLYNQQQQRFVSYLISYKWFEGWKIYVKTQYGVNLQSAQSSKKPITFKTRKIIRNKQSDTKKKIAENLQLRELKWNQQQIKSQNQSQSQRDYPQKIKNYDFVHSNIGEKPHQIYNNVLQGEYEQILKEGIIQNRDYILISEKVWKSLKRIYGGIPEFRRTGFDFIELYPKILKILRYKNEKIDYSDGTIKQVSGYYAVQDVVKAMFGKDFIQNNNFYFKCIGMKKWEKIQDLSYALAEITTQVMIFFMIVPNYEADQFENKRIKVARDITETNVGDFVKYQNPNTKVQQTMVIMGKNTQGKYVLHIPGESYIYDICVMEKQLFTKGKMIEIETVNLENGKKLPPIDQIKIKRKQQIGYVGISNMKGLNFINTVIIHLYHDIQFRQILLLRQTCQQQNVTVLGTLSAVFRELSSKKKVNITNILDMVEQIFPDFKNFSVNMCGQFINQFYKKISQQFEELELKDLAIKYQLQTIRKTKCLKCQNNRIDQIKPFCLTLPVALSDFKFYEIIFVPYNQTLNSLEIKRYGFKLPAGATLKNYKDAFEAVAGIMPDCRYLLMQVYANNIVKNYSTAKNEVPLNQLMLRDTDKIVAYELQTDFSDFIAKHYSNNVDYETRAIYINQFIDCKNDNRGWIFGKVCETDYTPYGHRTIIRVIHKFSKGQEWQISYDVDQDTVAHFPTKSYLNGQQYHIRLQQRYFNEASNDMQLCSMPLVVVLTNWMRWREFYYMVYLQMKRFMVYDISNDLKEEEGEQSIGIIPSSKSISDKRKTNKIRLNRFKDFLYGQQFPYRLVFVDYSGRCAICFKFLKSVVYPKQQETYCSGCKLSKTQPLSWQIKVSDVMVCVDWKGLDLFKKNNIQDHSTFANMSIQRKNDVDQLDGAFRNLKQGFDDVSEEICCATNVPIKIFEDIKTAPQSLILQFDRIIEQNGYIKTIKKHIKFEDEIDINGKKYILSGVTSIEGSSTDNTKYRTFVNYDGNSWIQYDGKVVKNVKKNIIDRTCALNLYYKLKNSFFQTEQIELKKQQVQQK